MDFAQLVLRILEENTVERRKEFEKALRDYITEMSNSIRGTSVSKFKLERMMKEFGDKLEHLLLTEIPQKQNIRVAKKLNKRFKSQTKELRSEISKKEDNISELKNIRTEKKRLVQKLEETEDRLEALQQQNEMTNQVIKTNQELQNQIKKLQNIVKQLKENNNRKDQVIDELQTKIDTLDDKYQKKMNNLIETHKKELLDKEQYWKLKVTEATVSKEPDGKIDKEKIETSDVEEISDAETVESQ